MFPPPLQIWLRQPLARPHASLRVARDRTCAGSAAVRLAGLILLLAVGLSQRAGAQASGTLQVTARVRPAAASWSALHEARAAVRALRREPFREPTVRRSGLVSTRTELQGAGSRRRLVVTLQHPRN